ncbi:Uncharacterised protein [Bordetella pertussis]|nr:Uncharacterised protein [Bordetella pertussis]CFM01620.1 Uncharacterised protein [Bordetella pertussis]CFM31698.1 Uncharacterised protein [Bordetella pertussis]CFM36576.1 Uncharacterised protein [Bordetella pertussis]CFN10003.1 Uncharacterised protein [Bordetella pertussis]
MRRSCRRRPAGVELPAARGRGMHLQDRQGQLVLAAEQRRPDAAGHHHLAGAHQAALGLHTGHAAALDQQFIDRALLDDLRTVVHGVARQQRNRARRFRIAIALGTDAAYPGRLAPGVGGVGLARRQHPGRHAARGGGLLPALPGPQLGRIVGHEHHAGLAKARIHAGIGLHAAPQVDAQPGQLQLADIAPQRAAPPPIAAALLGGHPALLDDRDPHAEPRQFVRGRDPGRARADDGHIHLGWRRVGRVDAQQCLFQLLHDGMYR